MPPRREGELRPRRSSVRRERLGVRGGWGKAHGWVSGRWAQGTAKLHKGDEARWGAQAAAETLRGEMWGARVTADFCLQGGATAAEGLPRQGERRRRSSACVLGGV